MKSLSVAMLVVLVSVLVLASASTTVLAAPTIKKPFSATTVMTGMEPPKRSWTDEEGVIHIRGMAVTASMTGDIVGEVRLNENANLYPSGYGNIQAKGVILVGGEEAYTVSIDAAIIPYVGVSGTFVIHGVGSYKGIHIAGTLSTPPGSGISTWTGIKLTIKP